jgi:hypothetical protein
MSERCKRTLKLSYNGTCYIGELFWEGGRLWRTTFVYWPDTLIARLGADYDLTVVDLR